MDFDTLGSYYPINRSDKYPRALLADFSKLKPQALRRYIKAHSLTIRPDSTHSEIAVAVARHFDSRAKVDEEGSIVRFMNSVRKATGAADTAKLKRRARVREVRERETAYEAEYSRNARIGKRVGGAGGAYGGAGGGFEDGGAGWPPSGPSGYGSRQQMGYLPQMYGSQGLAGSQMMAGASQQDDGDDTSGDESERNVEVYCVCKRPSYGEMVACDNPRCVIEWFHIGCVGLTRVPMENENWFCNDCRPAGDSDDDAGAAAGRGGKGARSASQTKKRRLGGIGGTLVMTQAPALNKARKTK